MCYVYYEGEKKKQRRFKKFKFGKGTEMIQRCTEI